jgi:hypothetical protein
MAASSSSYYPSSYSQSSTSTPLSDDAALLAIQTLGQVSGRVDEKEALNKAAHLINASRDLTAPLLMKLIDVLLSSQKLGCTKLWHVFVHLEPLISNKQALAQAAAQLYLPDASPVTQENAQGALWFAAYIGDTDLAWAAIERGADVNVSLYRGMTALLLACKKGHDAFANLMLDRGANVKFIGGTHNHETPLSEALFKSDRMPLSLRRLQELDKGFTQEFLERKNIAHVYSIRSMPSILEGVLFYLEGFRPRYTLQHFLTQSHFFFETLTTELLAGKGPLYDKITASLSRGILTSLENHPETRKYICSAIEEMLLTLQDCLDSEVAELHAHPELMVQKALKRLAAGKPAACFGVTLVSSKWISGAPNSHAWGLVIFKDGNGPTDRYIVHRCNRGLGTSADSSGIFTRIFSHDELETLLQDYYQAANWKEEYFSSQRGSHSNIETQMNATDDYARLFQFGVQTIDKCCCARTRSIAKASLVSIFRLMNIGTLSIRQKGQRAGNCCYISKRSITTILLEGLLRPMGLEALSKSIMAAHTSYTRPQLLSSYLDKHYKYSSSPHRPDEELLKETLAKITQKSHTTFDVSLFSPELRHRLETLNTPFAQVSFASGLGTDHHPLLTRTLKDAHELDTYDHLKPWIKSIELPKLELSRISLTPSLNRLEELDLSDNQLKHLAIPALPSLKKLKINNNQLEEICVYNLPQLKSFSVNNNMLKHVEMAGLPRLKDADLSYNQLQVGPDLKLLPKLASLALEWNRLKTRPDLDPERNCYLTVFANPCSFIEDPESSSFSKKDLDFLPDLMTAFKQKGIYPVDASFNGSLAALYDHLITFAPESDPDFFNAPVHATAIDLFNQLPENDKSHIYPFIAILNDPESYNRDYGAEHCFENRGIFYAAIHNAILCKWFSFELPQREELQILTQRIEQTQYPEKDMTHWATDPKTKHLSHPRNNLLRLAMAYHMLESCSLPEPPSRCCLIL